MAITHMVQELLDQSEPRNNAAVTPEQYLHWARGFVFEGLRNQRYGQSFCNYFGIDDNILFYCDTVAKADEYIKKHYIK